MKRIFAFLFFALAFRLSAQERCAAMPAYQVYMEDPVQRAGILAAEQKARAWLSDPSNRLSAQRAQNSVIRIPVVVHVVYKTAAQNIPDSLIHSQLAVLNECFRKQNANYANTRPIFDTLGADTEIEFCLAAEDEAGYPTSGIIRKQAPSNAQFNILSGFDNMKKPSKGGDTAWASTSYLNIWVCDMSIFGQTFVLGYATFPGGNPALDGVVIQYDFFGKYAKPNFLGRTTVHEVGHWLGMRHIWADDDNGQNPQNVYCDSTDFVDDTPNAGPKSNSDCNTRNTCSLESSYWGTLDPPDMVENYMDYSSDACMTMFTKGQKARMYAFLATDPARLAISTSTAACHLMVGLSKSHSERAARIYPVPAKDELLVDIGNQVISHVTLYDCAGRKVLSQACSAQQIKIDVSSLPEGFYFLKAESGKGVHTGKVLIAR